VVTQFIHAPAASRVETSSPFRFIPTSTIRPRPIRSWSHPHTGALLVLDLVSVASGVASATVVVGVRDSILADPATAGTLLIVAGLVWIVTLAVSGAYCSRLLGGGSDEHRMVLGAMARFFALVASAAFVLRLPVPPGFILVAVGVAGGSGVVLRSLLRRWLDAARRRGDVVRRVMVVGARDSVGHVLDQLGRSPHTGFTPVGACLPGEVDGFVGPAGRVPVIAAADRALTAAVMAQADTIIVADATTLSASQVRRLAWELEGTGIEVMVAPDATDIAGPRISVRPVSGLPLLHIDEPELRGAARSVKALVDRLLGLVGLIVLSPALAAIFLLVRLTSRGPVFFRQVRVGLGGRHFVVWKFRTMTRDAEARLASVHHMNEHDGPLFKMKADPRITRVGRSLRRWSLDELPQLWNVLRGDMSIVGPRPPIPSEVARYDDQVHRRLLVKPGITGLWQVSGRAQIPWDEAVRLDLYYVENWSLSMDALILARTTMAVVRGHGAY